MFHVRAHRADARARFLRRFTRAAHTIAIAAASAMHGDDATQSAAPVERETIVQQSEMRLLSRLVAAAAAFHPPPSLSRLRDFMATV